MEDKNTRRALIEKYLNAETTPEEERRLREWFASHEADEDERDFALLVGLEAPCGSCLPELDDTEVAFDRIMAEGGGDGLGGRDGRGGRGPIRGRRHRWLIGLVAAAALAAIVWLALPSRKNEPSLPPVVIAESIRQILLLSPDDIESVEARPDGSRAILTAHLKDGTSCSYILTYDEDEDTTTLLACQNPSK